MSTVPPNDPAAGERLMTVAEVAEYLRVSTSWVYKKSNDGELPHTRVGALLRFRRSEIDNHLRHGPSARGRGTIHRIK